MTATIKTPEDQIESFYDALSESYDAMTGFESRFVREKPYFRFFVERHAIASALDAGCGTGFHALLLSQLGVRVTATDVSQAMIDKLIVHARRLNLKLQTLQASFETLSHRISDRFDAIFCLGNGLPHILDKRELDNILRGFHQLLRPGGTLITQTLNYDRILKDRPHILSTTEYEQRTFIRSYQYENDQIVFQVQAIDRSTGVPIGAPISIPLRPLRHDQLLNTIADAGFTNVKSYGGLSLPEFDYDKSKDLVITATAKALDTPVNKDDAHQPMERRS
ncbi:MAG: class I SAM-dependent methyltransferase [Ignavibacteriales bacterium]|nr:class I SAM-dependent methyltransferase [Ignavibacteriales bacterium]